MNLPPTSTLPWTHAEGHTDMKNISIDLLKGILALFSPVHRALFLLFQSWKHETHSYTCHTLPVKDLFQHSITSNLHAICVNFIICHKTQSDNLLYLFRKKRRISFYMHNFICGFNVLVTDFMLNFLITFSWGMILKYCLTIMNVHFLTNTIWKYDTRYAFPKEQAIFGVAVQKYWY